MTDTQNIASGDVDTTSPYTIVSSDTHAGLQCEEYREYLDPSVMDEFEEYIAERHQHRRLTEEVNGEYIAEWEGENEYGLKGAYDPDIRDKTLDKDGIAGEVIFADGDSVTGQESPPFGAGLSAGQITDPKLAFAGARAHNRWLVEFCATNPPRRAGVALVPVTFGIEESVKEIESLAGKPGIKGIMVPTMWHDAPAYNDPVYDPIWAACQDAEFVVHTHSGEADFASYNDNVVVYMMEVPFFTHRMLWHMLYGGVFERFPGLRYAVVECGSWWLGDLMYKGDVAFGGGGKVKKMTSRMKGILSKLPSEYFGENIFIGASTMSTMEIRRRHIHGLTPLMWGTDYPHPEGSWPHTEERLTKDFQDVSIEDTRKLLGENAIKCYGLDVAGLGEIAARIGPTPTDLNQDPTLRTSVTAVKDAQWWIDEYNCEFHL